MTNRTSTWLAALLGTLIAAGCSQTLPNWGGRQAIDPELPSLPILEHPREQDGKVVVKVKGMLLPQLDGHITELSPGPRTLLVITGDAPASEREKEGGGAIALWLRGRGSQQARLPQYTSGRVNPATSQDWQVDLIPGQYLLSVSYPTDPGSTEAVVVVR
jgi:hypothetical protein